MIALRSACIDEEIKAVARPIEGDGEGVGLQGKTAIFQKLQDMFLLWPRAFAVSQSH